MSRPRSGGHVSCKRETSSGRNRGCSGSCGSSRHSGGGGWSTTGSVPTRETRSEPVLNHFSSPSCSRTRHVQSCDTSERRSSERCYECTCTTHRGKERRGGDNDRVSDSGKKASCGEPRTGCPSRQHSERCASSKTGFSGCNRRICWGDHREPATLATGSFNGCSEPDSTSGNSGDRRTDG